jgi:hypothetical protein
MLLSLELIVNSPKRYCSKSLHLKTSSFITKPSLHYREKTPVLIPCNFITHTQIVWLPYKYFFLAWREQSCNSLYKKRSSRWCRDWPLKRPQANHLKRFKGWNQNSSLRFTVGVRTRDQMLACLPALLYQLFILVIVAVLLKLLNEFRNDTESIQTNICDDIRTRLAFAVRRFHWQGPEIGKRAFA